MTRERDSTFGAEPRNLDRLVALGLGDGGNEPSEALESEFVGPGTIIGRYKLLEKIGEGGMAVVYMAEQTEPIRRKVAFKIIKLGMDTKQVIARFEAERQALALMDDPSIAKVLDAGSTDTGRPYFVMELVQGTSITDYCDKNSLNTTERLNLFIQVCQAVQHAHQKGIIHRDIKPSNVMVTHHDGKPVPKVIDFGIAKATNQRLTEEAFFIRCTHIIGTPVYMSPEQAELSDLDVDTRSDIYSLGVLLYELLTGTTPFSEEELRKVGYAGMQRIIREQEPAKPSAKLSMLGETLADVARCRSSAPDLLKQAVRGDLDWIVMKCLEKDRSQRYETVSSLVRDIRRHLESGPVLARSSGPLYRLRRFLRCNCSQVFAGLAVAAATISVVDVLSSWYRDRQVTDARGFRHRHSLLSRILWGSQPAEADRLAESWEYHRQADVLPRETAGPCFLQAMTILWACDLVGGRVDGNPNVGAEGSLRTRQRFPVLMVPPLAHLPGQTTDCWRIWTTANGQGSEVIRTELRRWRKDGQWHSCPYCDGAVWPRSWRVTASRSPPNRFPQGLLLRRAAVHRCFSNICEWSLGSQIRPARQGSHC